MICALNFSYSVFKQRRTLCEYFKCVKHALKPDGLFFTGRKPRAATSTSRTSTPPTAPGSVSECLGGAATYEEYVRKLQSDGSLAYKALCALAVWSGNDSASSFVGAVNALPRE